VVTRPSPDALRQELGDRVAELGEFIKSQREVASMSVRRLADLAGVSNPYLSQIERGLRRPSAEILQQLARALEISAETLYVRAGILDPTFDEGDLVAAIRRDGLLTEPQKRTLIHIYESFRNEALAARAAVVAPPPPPPPGTAAEPAADGESRRGGRG
jgi:transcriptional regulator with XRE-family HTH domain